MTKVSPETIAENSRSQILLSLGHRLFVAARRLHRLIVARRGTTQPGRFPMYFTRYNDLALDYLAQRLLEHERAMIDEIGQCVAQLDDDPEARRLAREVLASEERRLKMLNELLAAASRDQGFTPLRLAA